MHELNLKRLNFVILKVCNNIFNFIYSNVHVPITLYNIELIRMDHAKPAKY